MEFDNELKRDELDVDKLIGIIGKESQIPVEDIIVEIKIDKHNNVVSVMLYVENEQVANTLADAVTKIMKQC